MAIHEGVNDHRISTWVLMLPSKVIQVHSVQLKDDRANDEQLTLQGGIIGLHYLTVCTYSFEFLSFLTQTTDSLSLYLIPITYI